MGKAYEQAYKLLVLFGRNDLKTSMDALTRYVKNFNFKDKKNNLDELVDFSLPVCADNLHLPTWRVSIMVNGPQATKLFEYATAIQNMLGYTPKTFEEIKKAVAQIKYARFKENPELAELWQQYELPEDGFNRALEYKPNPIDIIPDASIRGTGDDERYHLVKLPSNDLNAYVLGKIVHCCQYVGAEDVMRAVNNLYQYTILDKCEQVIRGCSKHTYSWVSGALIKLHENGLLDTYLPFLEQYPDKANLAEVCYALVNLHHVPEKTILSGDLHAFNNIDLIKQLLKSLQNNTVPVDEQITIQKQPEDVSMEPSTFSLRQFLANLWQGLKNTVNRLIRFVTSLFTYSTDERVQTDMGHRFVDETRDPITEDSYSRMANNITLNSDDSAAIAQSANNSATNRTTVEPPVPDRNETRTAVREEHEEEPISIRSFL
ncbi:hypothetical protein [Legionella sp.]|uniref:hypothetical protein n=1 Tax=Legionella sp. TaxID=459 RepID=UPI003D11439E